MKDLFAALVQCQGELGAALKDATNPHFKSKYADLASVVGAIKPVASKHGLGYVQCFHPSEGGVTVETIIVHTSGEHFSTGPLFVPASKQDAQGYGSAITYARRYSLQTAFGVPADDDDGNAAAASAPKLNQWSARGASLQGIEIDWQKVGDVVSEIRLLFDPINRKSDWEYQIWEMVDVLSHDEQIAVAEKMSAAERTAIKRIVKEQRALHKPAPLKDAA
jgi:hypothetical protein